jgi:putative endonuclease
MFYTYILYSEKLEGYYIGFTSTSPQLRLVKHLQATKGHTAKAKDWVLVHTESFETKQEAMAREKELKSWKSKERIIRLLVAIF